MELALLIAQKIGDEDSILGLDISKEILNLARKRCPSCPNVEFSEQRIETTLTYQEKFDRVFASLVLHGFEDAQKVVIIIHAYRALKPGWLLYIPNYNEFNLEKLWFPLRWAFVHGECQLASEFLKLDLKEMLSRQESTSFEEEFSLRTHL